MRPYLRGTALSLSTTLFACAPAANADDGSQPQDDVAGQEQELSGSPEAPKNPSSLAVFFRSEATIHATPEKIFDIIIDFDSYAEWDPWLVWAEGDAVVGGKVAVDAIMGGKAQRYDHVVIAVEPYTRFCWRDAGWNSYFAYAQRCRTLTPQADGTTLVKVETFIDGPLAWLGAHLQGQNLQSGQDAETAALKVRAESL
jgi:uncharacterized protein YndB with AHSA1/START domain